VWRSGCWWRSGRRRWRGSEGEDLEGIELDGREVIGGDEATDEFFDEGGGFGFGPAIGLEIFGDGGGDREVGPALIIAEEKAVAFVDEPAIEVGSGHIGLADEPVIIEIGEGDLAAIGGLDIFDDREFFGGETTAIGDRKGDGRGVGERPALGDETAFGAMDAGVHVVAGEDDGDEELIAGVVGVGLAGELGAGAEDGDFVVADFLIDACPVADGGGEFEDNAEGLEEVFGQEKDRGHSE